MFITESKLRKMVVKATGQSDNELIQESIILQEFIGTILRAITSPFRGLMNIYKNGLFNWLGKNAQTVIRNTLGTQKDVERKVMLSQIAEAEKMFVEQGEEASFDALVSAIKDAQAGVERALDLDSVFPTFGRIDIPTGEDKDDDDKRFAQSTKRIFELLVPLIIKPGAKFRGTVVGLVKAGMLTMKVKESPVDLTFPLGYVSSISALAKELATALPEIENETSKLVSLCDEFVSKFTPELKKLTSRVTEKKNEALIRILINSRIIQERRALAKEAHDLGHMGTFFANPYEDPGEEFDIDSEDPIGLIRAAVRSEISSQIHDSSHFKMIKND